MGLNITIYRDISCDITPDHPETPDKHNFHKNPPPRCGLLCVLGFLSLPSSWLVFRLANFVVCLLSISWTHHRTDRTTSKQPPCPLRTRVSAFSLSACFCFILFFLYFSLCIYLSFFFLDTRYTPYLVRGTRYVVVNNAS